MSKQANGMEVLLQAGHSRYFAQKCNCATSAFNFASVGEFAGWTTDMTTPNPYAGSSVGTSR